MQRVVRNSFSICIPGVRRSLALSLPSPSSYQHISLPFRPKTTIVPHRTVASSSQWTTTPVVFPTSGFELLDQSQELDEETLPTYQPEKYYPVNQGEIVNDRYQILAKIGYGVTSTVWLAKDLM